MRGFESTGAASRQRSTSWMPNSGWKRGSSSRCRRIWPPDTAGINRSRQRPPSIAIPLASPRYSPGRIAIPPRASRHRKASSTALHDPDRCSLRLFRELCRLDFPLTTLRHAQCQVHGETVTRTRRKRQFARTPQATAQQMRKWFSFRPLLVSYEELL